MKHLNLYINECCDCGCGCKCCTDCVEPGFKYSTEIATQYGFEVEPFNRYIKMLQSALNHEIASWRVYYINAKFGNQQFTKDNANKLLEIANDELNDHAEWLINKLKSYNVGEGYGCYSSDPLPFSSSISSSFVNMETHTIDEYVLLVEFAKTYDPQAVEKLKEILVDEQEHLASLQKMIIKKI